MDIKQFAELDKLHDEAVTDVIYQPDGEPYRASVDPETGERDEEGNLLPGAPCTISVVSEHSKRVQDALAVHNRKAHKQQGGAQDVAAVIKAYNVAKAAAALVGWTGFTADGKPWACTPANALAFVSDSHRRSQVEALMQRHASFFAKG